MHFNFQWLNFILFLSIIVYFIYDHFESKQVKDEREEFIKLKTYEFVQKVNTVTLLGLSTAYFFTSFISGLLIIFLLILSSLYMEILAKIYYRKKY